MKADSHKFRPEFPIQRAGPNLMCTPPKSQTRKIKYGKIPGIDPGAIFANRCDALSPSIKHANFQYTIGKSVPRQVYMPWSFLEFMEQQLGLILSAYLEGMKIIKTTGKLCSLFPLHISCLLTHLQCIHWYGWSGRLVLGG
jgi:hypothetical protein